MPGKNAIQSRNPCPRCGESLYYVRTFLFFLNGLHKRVCRAQGCGFEDKRRFRIAGRGFRRGL